MSKTIELELNGEALSRIQTIQKSIGAEDAAGTIRVALLLLDQLLTLKEEKGDLILRTQEGVETNIMLLFV